MEETVIHVGVRAVSQKPIPGPCSTMIHGYCITPTRYTSKICYNSRYPLKRVSHVTGGLVREVRHVCP
nr:hypothetical protein [Ktedonobacteraceae bacterium]